MRVRHIVFNLLLMLLAVPALAQNDGKGVIVDYNNPKKYIVGGVKVEGTNYFSPDQIKQITGLQEGMEITASDVQFSKALLKMLVSVEGRVMLVSEVQFLKALG